jgi:hypothetical protein
VIERSADGRHYTPVGTVAAAGNSTTTTDYSFNDNLSGQLPGILFYRLKIVDKDGSSTYSNIISISIESNPGKVSLYPNPAGNEVNVVISSPLDGRTLWQLIDNTGRVIMQNAVELRKGSNNIVINVNRLSPGIYYLSVAGAGVDQKVKLQKL